MCVCVCVIFTQVYATPATLTEVLLKFDPTKLVPYKKGDAKNIAAYITSAITAA